MKVSTLARVPCLEYHVLTSRYKATLPTTSGSGYRSWTTRRIEEGTSNGIAEKARERWAEERISVEDKNKEVVGRVSVVGLVIGLWVTLVANIYFILEGGTEPDTS